MTLFYDQNLQLSTQSTEGGCGSSCLGFALGLLACLLISLFLGGCRGKQIITETIEKPVIITQERHTESVKVDIVRDTIKQRDSIYYFVKGDTTIIEKWHYYTNNNQAVKVDTLLKVDSVQVPVITEKVVTKVQEIEKPLKWWQKFFIFIGGVGLVILGFKIAYRIGQKAMQK